MRKYKLIPCEHIKNKTQEEIQLHLWIGETTRVLLCPICTKVITQTAWDYIIKSTLLTLDVSKQLEYKAWIEKG